MVFAKTFSCLAVACFVVRDHNGQALGYFRRGTTRRGANVRDLSRALERQANAGFEIAAVVADADIATKVDDLVAELHLNSARKLAADAGTIWDIDTARSLRSAWTGAHGRLAGKRADLADCAGDPSGHALRISGAREDQNCACSHDPNSFHSFPHTISNCQ
jgi:hypothetical protein